MKVIKFFILLFIISLLSQPVYSDVIHLKNGAIYEGDIIKETPDKITIKLKMGILTINKKLINSIHKDKKEVVDSLSKDKNILEELKQKSMQINSYKCEFEAKLYDNSTMKGIFLFKRPNKMKNDCVVESGYIDTKKMKTVVISDGEVLWMYYPQMNIAYRQTDIEAESVFPEKKGFNPSDFIELMLQTDYTILGEEVINEDTTYCIESNILEEDKKDYVDALGLKTYKKVPAKFKLWLRTSDGFVIKHAGFTDKEELVFETQNRNIETNKDIDDAEFNFVAPLGVKVIDINSELGF